MMPVCSQSIEDASVSSVCICVYEKTRDKLIKYFYLISLSQQLGCVVNANSHRIDRASNYTSFGPQIYHPSKDVFFSWVMIEHLIFVRKEENTETKMS